jgi:DNA-directed RNA polymerase subunit RPC12/RpoP
MDVAERQARFRSRLRAVATAPERLPSGNYTDFCHDCGTRIVASTPEDVDGTRCACPPQRFDYLLELVCSLCSREIAAVRVPTPRSRVVLLRPVRCQICGGQALASGEVARVLVAAPLNLHPRRGRPPRGLQGVAA